MDTIESKVLLTNIQRFSLHDGPGIRTTVFLKGCSLRCPWCSNPENLRPQPEEYVKDGLPGTYGKHYAQDELLREVLKDKNFYEGKLEQSQWKITDSDQIEKLPGGVTFSGGEALLQMDSLVPVLQALKAQGIHTAVETCLFVPEENVRIAMEWIDFFYVDINILNASKAQEVEKGRLDLYLQNLDILLNSGCPVVIRIPVIGGFTDDDENRDKVKKLLDRYRDQILKIELIKEHNLGESKYQSLNLPLPAYKGVSDALMEQYKKELEPLGIPVEVCKI